MPNAPWAQQNPQPSITNVYPVAPSSSQDIPKTQYGSDQGQEVTVGKGTVMAGGTPVIDADMLDQLHNVVMGDPTVAADILHRMGWTGTVEQFKTLTPAQINVWATQHSSATRGKDLHSEYGAFYKDPVTGVYDFTKWYDGTASGYDSNMNRTATATKDPLWVWREWTAKQGNAAYMKGFQENVTAKTGTGMIRSNPSRVTQQPVSPPAPAPTPTPPPPDRFAAGQGAEYKAPPNTVKPITTNPNLPGDLPPVSSRTLIGPLPRIR